jgi:two-component sensor histidine kinase
LSNLTRKVSIAVEKSTLAGLFLTAQQMETAEQFAREALADLKDPRYAKQVTECYYTLCYVAIQKNKLDEATSNFEFAEKQLEFIRDEDYKMKIELLGAKVYYKTGRLNEAFQLANKVLEKAKKENKIALQQQSYSQLATIANKLGQYKKSLAYTIRFHELKDSVYLNKQNQYVQELDAKYQKAEQDLSIAELSLENEKNEARILLKNKQQVLYIIGLVSFALLGLSLFVLYSNNKMNSRELLTKNKIITKALSEKELLLKEIHHRVKNNLQVISSLLSIQSRFIKDPLAVSAINEGRNRVKSMAIIHQDLYRNDNLKGVNVEDYFEKLFESLFSSYNIKEDKIKLTAEIENIELDIDTIVPIGLIVNELISNALKYAFPENREGNIHIRLIEKNDKLILSIEDDGIGFNSTTELKKEESFGHELIDAFAQKLDASVSIESADGTSVIIEISNYKIAS